MTDGDKETQHDVVAAENKSLRTQLENLQAKYEAVCAESETQLENLQAENESLRAENDRLRTLLDHPIQRLEPPPKPEASFAPFVIPAPESKLFPKGWNKPGGRG